MDAICYFDIERLENDSGKDQTFLYITMRYAKSELTNHNRCVALCRIKWTSALTIFIFTSKFK